MLYKIIRPLARIAIRTTFRKIYFTNEDRIPWGKPVILAINHPTSFIEPCLLATHLSESLHFLARGDLFKKPLHAKFLYNVHILPIFRMKDGGYAKIKNNFSTLEKCVEAINEKRTILIMAEGGCVQEKRLRPLRKGTARLAFGALEKYPDLDIQIVPVGVNYTYPNEFRSEILLDFGQPIAVQEYVNQYHVHPQEAIKSITTELDQRLRKAIVIIDEKSDEDFTETLLQQYRNDHPDKVLPIVDRQKEERLAGEIAIARRVNDLSARDKSALKNQVNDYTAHLAKLNIDDWGLANPNFAKLESLAILIFGFLPFLLGYLGNYIPIKYTQYFKNNKVKEVEDGMSIAICVGIGGILVYYLLLMIICASVGAAKWIWFVILLPIWGFFSLVYREYFTKWWAAYRFGNLPVSTKLELSGKRRDIQEAFAKYTS